jgi:hypothetical protein
MPNSQIEVTGHGQLNGNLRININQEMDTDLAHRLRNSKPALIQFVRQQYPGAEISENSLRIRILPIPHKETHQTPSKKKEKKKPSRKPRKTQNSKTKNRPIWLKILLVPFLIIWFILKNLWKLFKWLGKD